MEAQAVVYGYGYRIENFAVGSGGHDPGDPSLALPLNFSATTLPGQFFGPEPIDGSSLISPTCPAWTCTLEQGEAVGEVSNFGLYATIVFIPGSSIDLDPSAVTPGTSTKTFTFAAVDTFNSLIAINGHGFSDGDAVVFTTTSTLPLPLSDVPQYYIVNSAPNYFQVSTTFNGSPIALTSVGSGTMTVRLATDDVFTYSNHGFLNGHAVSFGTTGVMPGGLEANDTYYVVHALANTFKVSPTLGGPTVDITSSGTGVLTVTDLDTIPDGAPEVGSTFLYAQTNFPMQFKLSAIQQTFLVTLQT
jgi:hypothetical protein